MCDDIKTQQNGEPRKENWIVHDFFCFLLRYYYRRLVRLLKLAAAYCRVVQFPQKKAFENSKTPEVDDMLEGTLEEQRMSWKIGKSNGEEQHKKRLNRNSKANQKEPIEHHQKETQKHR